MMIACLFEKRWLGDCRGGSSLCSVTDPLSVVPLFSSINPFLVLTTPVKSFAWFPIQSSFVCVFNKNILNDIKDLHRRPNCPSSLPSYPSSAYPLPSPPCVHPKPTISSHSSDPPPVSASNPRSSR